MTQLWRCIVAIYGLWVITPHPPSTHLHPPRQRTHKQNVSKMTIPLRGSYTLSFLRQVLVNLKSKSKMFCV